MKIILSMRNGHTFELPECTEGDFEKIMDAMKGFKESFVWNNTVWIRKSDVTGIVLKVEDPNSVA